LDLPANFTAKIARIETADAGPDARASSSERGAVRQVDCIKVK
jgi:hypothetical protein